jgi:hypothetical protein
MFESAYGHLKLLVTGTRNEGRLICKRYIQQKMNSEGKSHLNSSVQLLGSVTTTTNAIQTILEQHLVWVPGDGNVESYCRIRINEMIYHTKFYSKRMSSASHIVYTDSGFFELMHIVKCLSGIYMLCRPWHKVSRLSQLLDASTLPHLFSSALHDLCHISLVKEDSNDVLLTPLHVLGHALFVKDATRTFAIPMIVDFDHD